MSKKGKPILKTVPLDEAEDTLDPSSSLVPKKDTRRIWKHEDIEEFQVPDASFETPDALQSPFQYFKMLFTDEMIDHIAYHTNLYSAQELGDTIKTSPKEIEDFLAILLFMGVFNFPSLEDYWHHESLIISSAMRVKTDLKKIRPLFDMLREQCLQIPSTNKHSVDEVMVAYKGTRAGNLRQYIANKPDEWGFKVFCRASSSGIIHDLVRDLPHSSTLPSVKRSFLLCSVTTILPVMTDKELMKRGCGAFDYRSAEGVIAVKWFDNKCVNLLSNASGIMPLSTVKRWSKESKVKVMIPCPSLIPAYNEHMGGIDLSDMLVHLYKTPAKSTRWYLPLFGYMLDLSIANSWLVYKRECGQLNQKPITLKRFRLAVAHSLKQVNNSPSPPKKRYTPRPSQPQPDVRYDCFGHWPLHCDKWKCQKCNVFLCLNASQEYPHTECLPVFLHV
uniref:PiggyBac transposable element-derived protein domain-containing protein n=1 Tax=Pundamilia nyererei TaxID=303518 RepID=A0A3B4G8X8_9CICH